MFRSSYLLVLLGVLVTFAGCPSVEPDDDDVGDDDSVVPTDDDDAGDDDTVSAACVGDFEVRQEGDLDAVAHCVTISGYLDVQSLDSVAVVELPLLESVGSSAWISENPSIERIHLPALETVGDVLGLSGNDSLTDLDLTALYSVGRNMGIGDCPSLSEIDLPSLTTVAGSLAFYDDMSLTAVRMTSLETVGGTPVEDSTRSLAVWNNPSLSQLDAPLCTSVGGSLSIYDNAYLASTAGLSSMATVGEDVTITGNSCMSQADAEAFAADLDVAGEVTVEDNGDLHPCD